MPEFFHNRRVLGLKWRGVRLDRQTRQNIQVMPHTGDIAYPLRGSDALSKKSEVILSRNVTLSVNTSKNLNEVGQNKQFVKRVPKGRSVVLT